MYITSKVNFQGVAGFKCNFPCGRYDILGLGGMGLVRVSTLTCAVEGGEG